MSKLEELLEDYCPDGVEYKPLKNILQIKNGRDYKHLGEGQYPVYGSGGIMTYVDTYSYDKPSVLIPRKGSIDKLYYVEEPFWTVDTIFYTIIDTSIVLPKYVYYCLAKEHLEKLNKAGGVPSLTQTVINKVEIPVPPLPVQEEIVRILDMFTGLTAELTAELTARKKQYEYYRDQMLTFDSDIPHKKLGKSCILKAGKHISAEFISDAQDETHPYECFGGNGLRGYVSSYIYDGCYPLVGRQGALCGNVQYSHGKFYPTEHAVVVSPRDNSYDSRFLYHLLIKMDLNQYKSAGAQPGLAVKNLNEIEAPVPSMDIQRKIAEVLDHFDSLCSDISTGLPAEIEAREKQYEYYRDKLLSFKRKA